MVTKTTTTMTVDEWPLSKIAENAADDDSPELAACLRSGVEQSFSTPRLAPVHQSLREGPFDVERAERTFAILWMFETLFCDFLDGDDVPDDLPADVLDRLRFRGFDRFTEGFQINLEMMFREIYEVRMPFQFTPFGEPQLRTYLDMLDVWLGLVGDLEVEQLAEIAAAANYYDYDNEDYDEDDLVELDDDEING